MWKALVERFETHAPACVMARLALERALPATWIDEVFAAHRQRQYPRELLFSTVVELMTLVTLGLRPSLHAAARKLTNLPVSMAALYDKVKRTEPAILRGLVRGSAQRLAPVAAELGKTSSLPGWQLRIVDGNHLPASQKRLKPLRAHRGAALPGHSVVVYDPDQGLVCDLVACEDAYESERVGVLPLLDSAAAGQLWIADRHFCTYAVTAGLDRAGAHFLVREHARHPRLHERSDRGDRQRIDTGHLQEQMIRVAGIHDEVPLAQGWRRIEIALDTPTESGEATLALWTNLPPAVTASTIAALYRQRWRIEGMFQRLESVLHSEIESLGHPRAALLAFTVALLAYNVISLLQRAIEHAHRAEQPSLEVSSYHVAEQVKSGYEGMLIALPPAHWPSAVDLSNQGFAERLCVLAKRISPKQVATSKRASKSSQPKQYVEGHLVRAHVATARVLKQAKEQRP